jgi:hypothetical protein
MEGPDANTYLDVGAANATMTTSAAIRILGKINHGVQGGCNIPLTSLQTSIGGNPGLTYGGSGVSLAFWAKFDGIVGGGSSAAQMTYKIGAGAGIGLFFSSSTGAAVDFILDIRNSTQYPITVVPDVWYFWSWVWQADGSYKIYQNGMQIASVASAYSLVAGTGNPAFQIGSGTGGIGRLLTWFLDELGLWCNHSLTVDEINYLYNNGNGRTYPFT